MGDFANVHIGSVQTEITISEGVGSLSPDELQKIVRLVLDQVERRLAAEQQRHGDVAVRDRVFGQEAVK